MKLFLRFLLSLCVVLLSGYNQLHAHLFQDCIHLSPLKIAVHALHVDHCSVRDKHAFHIKAAPHGKKSIIEKIGATDEEEEDNFRPFSNKYLEISSYFLAFFGAFLPGSLCGDIKKRLLHCKLFAYMPSYTYLLFRTIRV